VMLKPKSASIPSAKRISVGDPGTEAAEFTPLNSKSHFTKALPAKQPASNTDECNPRWHS
jgi:hypothetical protein